MTGFSKIEMRLTIPGHMDYLSIAMGFISECTKKFGFEEKDQNKTCLASEEALMNIFLNALMNNPDETCVIICRSVPTGMEIAIQDKGIPFAFNEIPEYDPKSPDIQDNLDGLGLFLLKNTVDEVEFRNLGVQGNETLLKKNNSTKRIDSIAAATAPPDDQAAKPVTDWFFRPFSNGDAVEISRCCYHTYGYSYDAYIYYPEQLIEMNENKTLKSIVAVDQDNNIMGHIALKFDYPGAPVAEAGVAFVNPAYRKLGIFEKMSHATVKLAMEDQLYGVHSNAVATHLVTQKQAFKFGLISCGIMLGTTHSNVNFKGLSGETGYRDSDHLSFLPLKAPVRQIFPPARHKNLIDEIFGKLFPGGTGKSVAPEKTFPEPDTNGTRLAFSRTATYNTADIFCFASDPSMTDELRSVTKKLCLERLDVLYIYLDLESQTCEQMAAACEQMGFFFCGIRPFGLNGRHALILQYLNNLEMDFDKILVYDPLAKKLLEHIKACQP